MHRDRERAAYDALRRACRNLVENAIRYGERAHVRVERRADSIDIVVADDGPGITDSAKEQVFALIFRMGNSRNRETGGVGLGLSIARTIVRHHGGDIILINKQVGLRAAISLAGLLPSAARSRSQERRTLSTLSSRHPAAFPLEHTIEMMMPSQNTLFWVDPHWSR